MHVVSKLGFYVSRFVKPTLEQLSKARFGRRASHRGQKRVPLGRDLRVIWQTIQVDQALRLCDCLLVESRNPLGEVVLRMKDKRLCSLPVLFSPAIMRGMA
jgi:hypothetical protein